MPGYHTDDSLAGICRHAGCGVSNTRVKVPSAVAAYFAIPLEEVLRAVRFRGRLRDEIERVVLPPALPLCAEPRFSGHQLKPTRGLVVCALSWRENFPTKKLGKRYYYFLTKSISK